MRFLEGAVGRGNDPHPHLARHHVAHGLALPGLQHAQKAALHLGRHVAHFVEEHGAAVGLLEEPRLVGHRSREGAALVAEEL